MIFSTFESILCPPCVYFRSDTKSMQGHGSGLYREINISKMPEYVRL